jgi:hypothetical protein
MSILSKLGLGPSDAVKAVTDAVNAGADVVERWHPSEKAKHDMNAEDLAATAKNTQEARAYNPTSTVAGGGLLATIANATNVFVDAVNRLIRPGVAILLIGSTFGLWDVSVTTNDPVVLGWTEAVVGFYFGVRTITNDIPRLLLALKQLRSK